jgi:hypothetical protein
LLTENAAKDRLSGPETADPDVVWQRMRSTYFRGLLGRGLQAFVATGGRVNPLELGVVGSTDTHHGTAGMVDEHDWQGGIASLGLDDPQRLGQLGYNPGGLVAVWAPENTRAALFDALARRETFATSGPRIELRFGAGESDLCANARAPLDVVMGGRLSGNERSPTFQAFARRDRVGLARLEIVKGELREGVVRERVISIAEEGRDVLCSWRDRIRCNRARVLVRARARGAHATLVEAPLSARRPLRPICGREYDGAGTRVVVADLAHACCALRRVSGFRSRFGRVLAPTFEGAESC